jgi:hypothetical protein
MPAPAPGSPSRWGNAQARSDRPCACYGRNPRQRSGSSSRGVAAARQIFPAEDFVTRSGTPGHDPGILSDSLFIRLYARLNKTKGEDSELWVQPRWAIRQSISDQEGRRSLSKLVRSRDGACITCGRGDVPLDAGNYRRRECMATRFDYRNLAGHCTKAESQPTRTSEKSP